MAFKKGQSGNPGGRPRKPEGAQSLGQIAREHTTEAVATLAEVMRDKAAPPSARVSAASHLLDRGWGKPDSSVTVTTRREACDMSDDELAAIAAGAALVERLKVGASTS